MKALYQQMIIDHSRNPHGTGLCEHGHCTQGHNPLCGDKTQCCVEVEDGIITKFEHQTSGCSLSIASASLMAKSVKGMHVDAFKSLCKEVQDAMQGDAELSGKLACLNGTRAFPMRVKCVTFPWHALSQAIEQANYPLILKPSALAFWGSLVAIEEAVGIDLDFLQLGCYGWQFKAGVAHRVPDKKIAFDYGAWKLFVSEEALEKIKGTVIECTQDENGLGRKISYQHPSAKLQCGCGESLLLETEK